MACHLRASYRMRHEAAQSGSLQYVYVFYRDFGLRWA